MPPPNEEVERQPLLNRNDSVLDVYPTIQRIRKVCPVVMISRLCSDQCIGYNGKLHYLFRQRDVTLRTNGLAAFYRYVLCEYAACLADTYPTNSDTPLSYEAVSLHSSWYPTPVSHKVYQLSAPDLTYTLIRPLEEKYFAQQRSGNLAVVFCFLLNRAYFLRDRNITTSALSRSRAELCEIMATRLLKHHAHSMLDLALALTTSWPVYAGADPALIERLRDERDDDVEERVGNALEMAIICQAKRFLKSSAAQKVIDGIWRFGRSFFYVSLVLTLSLNTSGKIVYQADSSRSILSDVCLLLFNMSSLCLLVLSQTYKRNPIHFYDPHKAPLLDHYRWVPDAK